MGAASGEGGGSDVSHISGWNCYWLRWRSLGKGTSGSEDETRSNVLPRKHCGGWIRGRRAWGKGDELEADPVFQVTDDDEDHRGPGLWRGWATPTSL